MGWCHEFGAQICEGCGEPMVAGATACTCASCGANCTGRFAGCAQVWARGPRVVTIPRPTTRGTRVPLADAMADAMPPSPPVESGHAEPRDVLWLRDELRRLGDQLAVVVDGLTRQEAALHDLVSHQEAGARIVELADVLPERLGHAIAAALGARGEDQPGRGDELAARLAASLSEVRGAADGLRAEASRLRGVHDGVTSELRQAAAAIAAASSRVEERIDELGESHVAPVDPARRTTRRRTARGS